MLAALHPSPTQRLPPSMETSGVDATHQALAELIEGLIQADSAAFPWRFQALLALMRLHIAEERWADAGQPLSRHRRA